MQYLNRDKIWENSDVWSNVIDKAVKEELDFLRVGAKLFHTFYHDSEDGIPTGVVTFNSRGISHIPDSADAYLYEFGYRFDLTEKQVTAPKTRRDVELLVRDGAKVIAIAEDTIFFHGKDAFKNNRLPKQVKIEDEDQDKVGT